MKKGKIITQRSFWTPAGIQWEFKVDFDHWRFGPYTYVFHRENLYFHEEANERGSYFFPLKTQAFNNTEIFLETDDIVLAVWERWSLSWVSKVFIELVQLKTQKKHRLYPDEVSLIYNSKNTIIIYYKKSGKWKKLTLDIKTLEKKSETSTHYDAFFKLFYNHNEKHYGRLVFYPITHTTGYFVEKEIIEVPGTPKIYDILWAPKKFNRSDFFLFTYAGQMLDSWELSLTWTL